MVIITISCPECECEDFFFDRIRAEVICLDCKLVLRSPNGYVGLMRIDYPLPSYEEDEKKGGCNNLGKRKRDVNKL